jgi:DNA-directed RNA polymerase omega subunit
MANKTSIEKVDIDACLRAFDGNRYNLVIAAAARAREIAQKRTIAAKNGSEEIYESKPAVESLCQIADGT